MGSEKERVTFNMVNLTSPVYIVKIYLRDYEDTCNFKYYHQFVFYAINIQVYIL